jgi:hypothetical protein
VSGLSISSGTPFRLEKIFQPPAVSGKFAIDFFGAIPFIHRVAEIRTFSHAQRNCIFLQFRFTLFSLRAAQRGLEHRRQEYYF